MHSENDPDIFTTRSAMTVAVTLSQLQKVSAPGRRSFGDHRINSGKAIAGSAEGGI